MSSNPPMGQHPAPAMETPPTGLPSTSKGCTYPWTSCQAGGTPTHTTHAQQGAVGPSPKGGKAALAPSTGPRRPPHKGGQRHLKSRCRLSAYPVGSQQWVKPPLP